MRLDHQFSVPAPIADVWQAVNDPERVAPCMPGASLTEVNGNTFRGSVKVKMGPVSLLYKGSGEFMETDESARKVVIKASGKDAKGAGTAAATVTVTLTPDGDSTNGAVATDLNITGRPAQFGRGMISDVGSKILDSFAECLSDKLAGPAAVEVETATVPEEPMSKTGAHERPKVDAAPTTSAERPDESGAIDLVNYAGGSVAKRVAPVAALVAAFAVLLVIARVRRRRKASAAEPAK